MIVDKATAMGWLFAGTIVVAALGLLILFIVELMAERREDRTAITITEKPEK